MKMISLLLSMILLIIIVTVVMIMKWGYDINSYDFDNGGGKCCA